MNETSISDCGCEYANFVFGSVGMSMYIVHCTVRVTNPGNDILNHKLYILCFFLLFVLVESRGHRVGKVRNRSQCGSIICLTAINTKDIHTDLFWTHIYVVWQMIGCLLIRKLISCTCIKCRTFVVLANTENSIILHFF